MKKEDYDLIREISNDSFPLYDFVSDIDCLFDLGRLKGFDYQAMQDDLVRIAKAFKFYYEKSEHWYH